MDNHVVVGVGNIYANEALYAAGIHPKRAAGNISTERLATLVGEIKRVLAEAIKQGGTTLKDFTSADGKPGYFVQQLQVYGRGGQPCFHCHTLLSEIRLGQRTTVFCSHCQR
jgi:formamidopyrimidine-DNA glycosylase